MGICASRKPLLSGLSSTLPVVDPAAIARGLSPVHLHVYDLLVLNYSTADFGVGVYHTGVQVYHDEYCFSGHNQVDDESKEELTGVRSFRPPTDTSWIEDAIYKESFIVGYTALSEAEVDDLFQEMKREFVGPGYNVLKRNCNDFSVSFIERLLKLPKGGGDELIPPYINRVVRAAQKVRVCLPSLLTKDLRDQLPPRAMQRSVGARGQGMDTPQRNYVLGGVREGSSAEHSRRESRAAPPSKEEAKAHLLEERRKVAARLRKQQEALTRSVERLQQSQDSRPVSSGSATARPSSSTIRPPARPSRVGEASSSSSSSSSSDSDSDSEKRNVPQRRPAATPAPAPAPAPQLSKAASFDDAGLGTYVPFDPWAASAQSHAQGQRELYQASGSMTSRRDHDRRERDLARGAQTARGQREVGIHSTYVPTITTNNIAERAELDAQRRRAVEAERSRQWRTPDELAAAQAMASEVAAGAGPRYSVSQAGRRTSVQPAGAGPTLPPEQPPSLSRSGSRRGSFTLPPGVSLLGVSTVPGTPRGGVSAQSPVGAGSHPLSNGVPPALPISRRGSFSTQSSLAAVAGAGILPVASVPGTPRGGVSSSGAPSGSMTSRGGPSAYMRSNGPKATNGVPLVSSNNGSQTARARF